MLNTEASPPLSPPPFGGPPDCTQDSSTNPDIEMDLPLTAMDDCSNARETTPSKAMSSFPYSKGRQDRTDRPQTDNRVGSSNGGTNTENCRSSKSNVIGMTGPENSYHRGDSANKAGGYMVPIGDVVPGPAWPTEDQLKVAKGYAIRYDDGSFARLYRVDELSGLAGVDLSKIPVYQGPEGLISLPPLMMDGQKQFVSKKFVDTLPPNRPVRPKIPAHRGAGINIVNLQNQIDNIVTRNPNSAPATPARPAAQSAPRRKVYCDKWIHEGICAFTQQGCRFLHVMPLDKATQRSLGLNQGLPAWWKRDQAVHLRPAGMSITPPTPTHQAHTADSWRPPVASDSTMYSSASVLPSPASTGHGVYGHPTPPSSGHAGYGPYGQSNYGPIAPPPPQHHQPAASAKQYSSLEAQADMNMEDEEDEGEITFSGRRC